MSELRITPWRIESRDVHDRSYRESIFSQGNGYMGTRGYRPDQRGDHSAWRSTFLSGFYEYVRPRITDMVNQPDFSGLHFQLNGIDSEDQIVSDFVQTLDMKNGLVVWKYVLTDQAGHQTEIRHEKILSMADRHVAAIRLCITPINWSGDAKAWGGVDASVENLPISDDQLTENIVFVKMWSEIQAKELPLGGILMAKTEISKRKIVMGYEISCDGKYDTELFSQTIATTVKAALTEGNTWIVEKKIAVASYRDGDPEAIVNEKLLKLSTSSFDQLLADSSKAWAAIWDDTDIQITGNDEWQGAIRYNIFQLVQTMPYDDPHASIGARGLTHGRYKGCYFWDTEIFMLPFFTHTQPDAARTLLEYRYNTLPDALESAKAYNTKGARFSWMSSDTGFEQCETWDTGCCEIHITADIAHAIVAYYTQSADEAFMRDCGVEILIQTARYWTDRFTYAAGEDRYHLLFVKGPDEYCGVTVDDFYTVSMAKDNLEAAIQAIDWIRNHYPENWAKLQTKVSFDDIEPLKWSDMVAKMVLTKDPDTQIWKQDATFHLLEPLDIQAHKDDDVPLYHKIGFDRLQRYQVLKQPAVLMYMALRPDKFSRQEVEAAWNYYEPKTLHDSTLSFGIHALLAARLGRKDEAVKYFEKSLFLDLKNVMKNTAKEGIHTASLGATWQAMILGFGGISTKEGKLVADNLLPQEISGISYKVYYRGEKYQIDIAQNQTPKILRIIYPLK